MVSGLILRSLQAWHPRLRTVSCPLVAHRLVTRGEGGGTVSPALPNQPTHLPTHQPTYLPLSRLLPWRAGMSQEEKVAVEGGYKSGAVSVLCATSTLAAGVTQPARRVIFRQPYLGRPDTLLDATKSVGTGWRGEPVQHACLWCVWGGGAWSARS